MIVKLFQITHTGSTKLIASNNIFKIAKTLWRTPLVYGRNMDIDSTSGPTSLFRSLRPTLPLPVATIPSVRGTTVLDILTLKFLNYYE